MPFGFDFMFTVIPVIVIGMFIYVFGSMLFRALHNSQQPLLTRRARVVGRRQRLSRGVNHHAHTAYFVTFEFEDGSREEFSLRGDQYAMLAEGDAGTLQSQGSWFKGFDREISRL
ncbi:MAG: DUF2500 domain-containing protein [Bacillota bacterium]